MGRPKPPLKIQHQVIIEQMGRCAYCNSALDEHSVNWDHFIPFSYLESNPIDNWVAACKPCNSYKGNRVFSTEGDLSDFCLAMVKKHGSWGEGWPEGPSWADLRHSEAIL